MERARRLPESAASARTARLAALFAAQRESLWGLAYRLTGCADDADDVVQEAFARLLARPPDRVGEHPGPWLAAEGPDPERRYGLAESATLEALSPRQRAVLLLRDVLGHAARETAAALGATEANVRVLHLRAQRALEGYDGARCVPTPESVARHRAALERFLGCLLAQASRC